jgi:tRNA pseudouridine38-40 synthase
MTPAPAGRLALGISYRGSAYQGWQTQPGGQTVQDVLERALGHFAAQPIGITCAGRTDSGVHAVNQVVHFDAPVLREPYSWVRGTNRFLPDDVAVQWALPVSDHFHARNSARGRRYRYLLRESAVRPALDRGLVGWSFRALDGDAMRAAAAVLVGTHDFSAFRSSDCQSPTPVKTLKAIGIHFEGRPLAGYWCLDFDANAFLHHMVRNVMGCLVAVGSGRQGPGWMAEVLASRSRDAAAPTFAAEGLHFLGPYYDAKHAIPEGAAAAPWMPLPHHL